MIKDMQTGNTKTHGFNIHVIFETDSVQQSVILRKQTKQGRRGAITKSETVDT